MGYRYVLLIAQCTYARHQIYKLIVAQNEQINPTRNIMVTLTHLVTPCLVTI